MLQSDLCYYTEAYIVLKGTITVKGDDNRDIKGRFFAFKNNVPFICCISNINSIIIDNVKDLDVVMPMCNLPEYSKSYRKTTGGLWNYYRDEPNIHPPNNYNANSITNFASFKYKSSITVKTSDNDDDNDKHDNRKK